MIQIINNKGLILELEKNMALSVERNNNLFSGSDSFLQDMIYPGKAGLTDSNIEFISGGHRIDANNSLYEFPVTVIASGNPFYGGVFSYKIANGQIEYNLKVNFGVVAEKVKNTVVRDIMTLDSYSMGTTAATETYMKETCTRPLDFPYAFFPVYNKSWKNTGEFSPWMNYFDYQNQKFSVTGTLSVPFFRVKYILERVFEYLGFTLQGDILKDPEFNSFYFYNRVAVLRAQILPSLCYMPDKLKITDLLTGLCNRLKVNFSFDVLSGNVIIESAVSVLNQNEYLDLCPYISDVKEISTSQVKGYTVTLKPDETDQAMNMATSDTDEDAFLPAFSLVVGDGGNPVELDISTLKEKLHTDGYITPETDQEIGLHPSYEIKEWPLKLLSFKGMRVMPDTKIFPEAKAVELSDQDASFYKFLNDSKKVQLSGEIPPDILSKMKTSGKIAFKSNEGILCYAITVKNQYSLINSDLEFIPVKIEAQLVQQNYTTQSVILPTSPPDKDENRQMLRYKFANSDGSMLAEKIEYFRVPKPGSTATFESIPAKAPADLFGVGGQIGMSYATGGSRIDIEFNSIWKLMGKKPKYSVSGGVKLTWIQVDDYYQHQGTIINDGRPMLIVF